MVLNRICYVGSFALYIFLFKAPVWGQEMSKLLMFSVCRHLLCIWPLELKGKDHYNFFFRLILNNFFCCCHLSILISPSVKLTAFPIFHFTSPCLQLCNASFQTYPLFRLSKCHFQHGTWREPWIYLDAHN